MLSYLFENFDERAKIVAKLEDNANLLEQYIANRCAPNPSYLVSTQQRCASYFGIHNDEAILQFFSKGQLKWIAQLQQENVAEEQAVKELFLKIFREARHKLEQSELSAVAHQLQLVMPQLTDHMLNATWQHFLEGTYGVCTKDGLPATIAKKQGHGEEGADTLEYRERHRDGHYVWILSRGKPVEWDEDGNPVRALTATPFADGQPYVKE